jgi:hypothetical protein
MRVPQPGAAVQSAPLELVSRPGRSLLLSPAVLSIASRFTKAERLLHFQSRGLDANLWGALNGGRGVKINYVIRF